jgi:hypothetical protein
MHQQLAHETHDQIRFGHTPELTSFEKWEVNGMVGFDFYHAISCALTGN